MSTHFQGIGLSQNVSDWRSSQYHMFHQLVYTGFMASDLGMSLPEYVDLFTEDFGIDKKLIEGKRLSFYGESLKRYPDMSSEDFNKRVQRYVRLDRPVYSLLYLEVAKPKERPPISLDGTITLSNSQWQLAIQSQKIRAMRKEITELRQKGVKCEGAASATSIIYPPTLAPASFASLSDLMHLVPPESIFDPNAVPAKRPSITSAIVPAPVVLPRRTDNTPAKSPRLRGRILLIGANPRFRENLKIHFKQDFLDCFTLDYIDTAAPAKTFDLASYDLILLSGACPSTIQKLVQDSNLRYIMCEPNELDVKLKIKNFILQSKYAVGAKNWF